MRLVAALGMLFTHSSSDQDQWPAPSSDRDIAHCKPDTDTAAQHRVYCLYCLHGPLLAALVHLYLAAIYLFIFSVVKLLSDAANMSWIQL